MSKKRKISVVVSARPSYSRIKTALQAIKDHPELELQLVVGASALLDRYGNAVDYIEKDGFDIASKVYMVLEGENLTSMAKTTGLGLLEITTAFDNLRPDIVVTVADRFETIATAIAASYMNIPVSMYRAEKLQAILTNAFGTQLQNSPIYILCQRRDLTTGSLQWVRMPKGFL